MLSIGAMPTIQEIDRRLAQRLAAARAPLIAALAEAARGRAWHFLLFGSMARGTPRRGSDADIAIVDAGDDWPEAEQAAGDICERLGLKGDITRFEYLPPPTRRNALREGIRCG